MAERLGDVRELLDAVDPESVLPYANTEALTRATLDRFSTTSGHLIEISERIAPYWSRLRDRFLWECAIKSDILSSALNITSARLYSIPFNVVPRDKENRRVREVAYWSDLLLKLSWSREMYPFILDWQGQDNGAFMEVIGAGNPSGPIEPTLVPGTSTYLFGLGLRHLDSQLCIRTNDPTYPVLYEGLDERGRAVRYKLHKSRVVFSSQMRNPRFKMNGVGLCATSRCLRHVQHMDDIDILKEEWLGSRPVSEIIFGRGFSASDLENAFLRVEERANNDRLKRFAKVVFLGMDNAPADLIKASSLERISMKRLPDGYDEEKSITVALNVIAMALGFDVRVLWPATVRGATRADAEVQHLQTMTKAPGIWVNEIETQLNEKFSPVSCFVSATQEDLQQDAVKAQNQQLRAIVRQTMLTSGQIDQRINLQMMLEDGDITEKQYTYLIRKCEEQEQKDGEREEHQRQMEAAALESAQNQARSAGQGSPGVPPPKKLPGLNSAEQAGAGEKQLFDEMVGMNGVTSAVQLSLASTTGEDEDAVQN